MVVKHSHTHGTIIELLNAKQFVNGKAIAVYRSWYAARVITKANLVEWESCNLVFALLSCS